ncbi:hypothetical protein NMY22_g8752 [Coprinellus aureogranulatus]|nr:hypothetical protein NMY22_g8752 [Coprinellus aureogranulatus]
MNAGKRQAATPTPRAEPPSAVKNVEESRQQRLQRAQARFRDRGGIFVPTNRNTLIDILLGKKEATPKRSTRSRSRSVSPHKPSASPTSRKGKRVSLSSSAAIAAGEISVHQPELRRSPRKKSTAASSGTAASRKKVPLESAGKKEKAHIVSDDDIPAAPTAKSGKRKAQVEENPFLEEEPVRKPEKKAAVPVSTGKKGKVAKGNRKQGKEPEASTSRLPSQAADSDTEVHAQPRSKSAKGSSYKPPSKPSKAKHVPIDEDDDQDDIPLASLKSRPKPKKRKLSIVQEEEEDDDDEVQPQIKQTRLPAPSPSPPPPRRPSKKAKVASEPAPQSPPPVKKSGKKPPPAQAPKAKAKTSVNKPAVLSDDESDVEPPLPKSKQGKASKLEKDSRAESSKTTTTRKAKAPVDNDTDDDEPNEPKKPAKGKAKTIKVIEDEEALPKPPKKAASRARSKLPDSAATEPPRAEDRTQGKGKAIEAPARDEPAVQTKGKGKERSRANRPPEVDEEERPKKSKGRTKDAAVLPVQEDVDPVKPSRKRPATTDPDEDESTPTKRMKTLLQEVDEQSPPAMRKAARERTAPSKSKPPSKSHSRKMKENTPTSDVAQDSPAKNTRSWSKPPSKITGPRKSVMIRMKQPLPPIEDNDPDPIDFLS